MEMWTTIPDANVRNSWRLSVHSVAQVAHATSLMRYNDFMLRNRRFETSLRFITLEKCIIHSIGTAVTNPAMWPGAALSAGASSLTPSCKLTLKNYATGSWAMQQLALLYSGFFYFHFAKLMRLALHLLKHDATCNPGKPRTTLSPW